MKIALTLSLLFLYHFTLSQSLSSAIKLFESGKLDQSKSILKNIESSAQNFTEAQYYLGRIYFDQEDYDTAEEYFEEAIEGDEKNSKYHLWLGNTYGIVARDANVFKQGLLAPKVKREYERAVELDNKNLDALWGLVQYYTQAPGFMGGSYEKATEMANLIAKVDKLRSHSAMISIYSHQEKFDLAEKEYAKAIQLDRAWNLNLGFFYQGRKEYSKANNCFEKLVNDDKLKYASLYQIGKTSALSGQNTERGIECLNLYLKHEPEPNLPSHAGALMRLGMIKEKTGNKTAAKDYYNRALKKDPKMQEAKDGIKRVSN